MDKYSDIKESFDFLRKERAVALGVLFAVILLHARGRGLGHRGRLGDHGLGVEDVHVAGLQPHHPGRFG